MSRIGDFGRSIVRRTEEFGADRRGNVALIFGLTLLPIGGLVGAALDYNRAIEFRTYMHSQADVTALMIATTESADATTVLAGLRQRLENHYGNGSTLVKNVTITTSWVGSSVYNVSVSADLATTLASLLPAAPASIKIGVTTSVYRKPAEWQWSLPSIKDLSNEAYDYNRISVYCYDESKKNESSKGRRLETLTPIADNYGTNYSGAKLPSCLPGETLSYKLWNVRNGKEPGKTQNLKWWQKNALGQDPETVFAARYPSQTDYYSFYTDTTVDPSSRVVLNKVTGGKENSLGVITTASDVTSSPIMETVLCTTNVDCKPQSEGGVLPNLGVKNKTNPQTASGACSENKSMFYGWEDRPPSAGGSDRDYDDIRIVVSCPTLIKVSDKEVRIIK